MDIVIRWFKRRPLRFIGGFLVFLSIGLLGFLVLLDIVAGLHNPYLGIIAYMILPGMLILGLILVPIDSWIQRRRRARGETVEYPIIDLCDPHQRNIATFFVVASVLILIVMTVVTYKGVEFMDTTTFCGEVCHRVMIPEFTAYLSSPHASVHCVECHIGPGAPWFVRSKLSGMRQVWHYNRGDYQRPIKTPVEALRPSRDTCENCHWPNEFYGSTLKTDITYRQDRDNTRVVSTMVMRVGSGGVPGSGIHSHMVSKIDYLPANEKYSEIAWTRVEKPDGEIHEYVNPEYSGELDLLREESDVRMMDCIDCHNRAAHHFDRFEEKLDEALTRREISPGLPFIKREAMRAVGNVTHVPTEEEQKATVQRIREIDEFYKREFPTVYKSQAREIRQALQVVENLYLNTYFPNMQVTPDTYPEWKSHEGCFRCHGVMVMAKGKDSGQTLSADCKLCHTPSTRTDPAELFKRM